MDWQNRRRILPCTVRMKTGARTPHKKAPTLILLVPLLKLSRIVQCLSPMPCRLHWKAKPGKCRKPTRRQDPQGEARCRPVDTWINKKVINQMPPLNTKNDTI